MAVYQDKAVQQVNGSIELIKQELEKSENRDLLMAVILFSDNTANRAEESFMFGFSTPHARTLMGFEEYAELTRSIEHQLIEQGLEIGETVNMSKSYDDYLARFESNKDASPLNAEQAKRFDAIVDKWDDGWSGFIYGMVCRQVQADLRQKYPIKL